MKYLLPIALSVMLLFIAACTKEKTEPPFQSNFTSVTTNYATPWAYTAFYGYSQQTKTCPVRLTFATGAVTSTSGSDLKGYGEALVISLNSPTLNEIEPGIYKFAKVINPDSAAFKIYGSILYLDNYAFTNNGGAQKGSKYTKITSGQMTVNKTNGAYTITYYFVFSYQDYNFNTLKKNIKGEYRGTLNRFQ